MEKRRSRPRLSGRKTTRNCLIADKGHLVQSEELKEANTAGVFVIFGRRPRAFLRTMTVHRRAGRRKHGLLSGCGYLLTAL